jgi:hypothetical protein
MRTEGDLWFIIIKPPSANMDMPAGQTNTEAKQTCTNISDILKALGIHPSDL